jgi:ubiquitin
MAPKRKASAMASTSKVSAKEIQSKRASKKQATEANDKNESDVAIPKAEPTTTKQDGVEQVDGKGASTFTLFPKLVLEIRIKIWGMAAPDPCIVIQCKSKYYIFDILLIPVMSCIETKLTPML